MASYQQLENTLTKNKKIRTHTQEKLRKIAEIERIREKKGLNPHLLLDEMNRARQKESVTFRKNLLESQYRNNYIYEYERLVGILDKKRLEALPQRTHLEKRKNDLKTLAKGSLEAIPHEIFL